jgi:hypothetical protein
MRLTQQWDEIERGLPESWAGARLALTVPDTQQAVRATALLGSFNPGRSGDTIRFATARKGAGFGPEHVRRILRKLDGEAVNGTLALVSSEETAPVEEAARATFVGQWEATLAELPRDWSDAYAEVDFVSTDYLERGALLLGPLNPARFDDSPAFRFRVARVAGYGASTQMTRRCLERLDDGAIVGSLRILRVLSETRHVATQGPVWYVGGKAV